MTGSSRRRFLAHSGGVMAAAAAQMSLMGRTAYAMGHGEYQALVCVLLAGGADSFNMLLPYDQSRYDDYAAIRADLALPREEVLALAGSRADGRAFALHPGLAALESHFAAGDLAFVANVGTLVEPVEPQAFGDGTAELPLGLFSHADQIAQWQTSLADGRVGTGVGGRMADLLASTRPPTSVSMNISLSGTNVFQTGAMASSYSVDAREGVRQVAGYDPEDADSAIFTRAMDTLLSVDYTEPFRRTYAGRLREAIDSGRYLRDVLEGAAILNTQFGDDPLARSLAQIARIISVRDALGVARQTFFVTLGGWDHHDDVLPRQAAMLPQLGQGLDSFQRALAELGVGDRVTTFTISDFGRTLTSNGKGSDHGWGGHQLVLGGGVAGGRVYGSYPDLVPDNPLDVGRGRYIPTTSVDTFYAELALWFGVAPAELELVLPNVRRFFAPESGGAPVGFMV